LSATSLLGWLCLLAVQGCDPSKSSDSEGIPVGVLLPFTGELSAYGADYERALILAEERVNEAGGVAGRKLHLVARDTHSNVERGLESAQQLLDLGVAAVIGPEEPELTIGMAPLLSSAGVTQILPTLSSPRSAGRAAKTDWFHIAPGPRLLGCMLGTRLYHDGRAHVVVANENDPFLFAMASSAVSNYNTLLKPGTDSYRTTASLLPFQSGQKSYVELITSVTRRNADSLVLLGYPESGAKIVAGWDVSGNGAPLYLAPTLQSRAFQLNCPPNSLEGSLGIGVDLPSDHAAFAKAFAERWAGAEPMPMAYFYYDALVLWALAAQAAAGQSTDFPENSLIQEQLVKVSKTGPNTIAWNEVEKGLHFAANGVGIDYQGASGNLDLGDDGELAVRGGATFWTIRGEEVIAEKAGACESANP
jgi:branched-chain amino acid transport system substrate-binding protein